MVVQEEIESANSKQDTSVSIDKAQLWGHFRLLFLSTAVYFQDEQRRFRKMLRLVPVVIFLIISLSHMGIKINVWIRGQQNRLDTSFILLQNFKVVTGLIFFIYWQYRGQITLLMNTIASSRVDGRRIRTIFYQTLVVCMTMFLIENIGMWVRYYLGVVHIKEMKDSQLQEEIKMLRSLFFMLFDFLHCMYMIQVNMILLNVLVRLLMEEVNQLNARLMKQELNECDLTSICEEFMTISRRVHCVNSVFEVYLFLMIGTNIPVSIFTVLGLLKRLSENKWCWIYFFTMSPDLILCFFELVGLTAMASALHAKLAQVPVNLAEHFRVNQLLDANPHNHIRCFLARSTSQSNLGISLWGFTIITKSLMLTVLSLTVTYFIMAIQFLQK